MSTTAVIISGAVTTGKSTLAANLAKDIGFDLINENTTGNYYKILDSIHPKHHPNAIYEHCWLYKKLYLFEALYDQVVLVVLDVNEALLRKNQEKRKLVDKTGDYLNMDPVHQQSEILASVPQANIIKIDTKEDYTRAAGLVKSLLKQ